LPRQKCADSASVIYDALQAAKTAIYFMQITAGAFTHFNPIMEELKIKRVMAKLDTNPMESML